MSHPACPQLCTPGQRRPSGAGAVRPASQIMDKRGGFVCQRETESWSESDHPRIGRADRKEPKRLSKIWKKDSKSQSLPGPDGYLLRHPLAAPVVFRRPRWGVRAAGRESLPQQKFTSHVGFFRFYVHQKHNPFKFVSFSYHFRCTFCIYYLIRLHHKELLIILARFHDRAFCICEVVLLREGYKLILVDRIFKDTVIRIWTKEATEE